MAELPFSSAVLKSRISDAVGRLLLSQAEPAAPGQEHSPLHFSYKAADAILTVPLRQQRAVRPALRALFHPGTANYERVAAFVQVADRFLPSIASRLSRSLLRLQALPLTYDQLSLLGYGSGATAFLLQQGDQRMVLKVYRRSLARSIPELEAIAHHFINKYKTVSRWYGGSLNLVPPATFLILQSPLLGCRAVGVLQPYIAGEKRDLFTDFSPDELFALLRTYPYLRRQFHFFAKQTLEIYTQQGRCVDFVGHENVMLSKVEDGEWQLQVVDNGIFQLDELKERAPYAHATILSYLEQLQASYERSLTLVEDE